MRWHIAAVVLMATSCAWAQTETYSESVLYSFCSQGGLACTDGDAPWSLLQASDGNFYGTSSGGGTGPSRACTAYCGTVFKISPSGQFTTLYSFCAQGGNCADGFLPGSLAQGSDGNFYGVTGGGGTGDAANCTLDLLTSSCGTVFKITPQGVLTTLYSFCIQGGAICTDGFNPGGVLAEGSDGNLYGTTTAGGMNGSGTAFKISVTGSLSTIYSFCSLGGTVCTDGSSPANLVLGSDGNFYGTTIVGGTNNSGTVFRITPSGALTTLYAFCSAGGTCVDGANPGYGVIQGSDGNYYGTTSSGGKGGDGTIFRISPAGVLTTLYSFCSQSTAGCAGGASPYGLVEGSDGNFYGTSVTGGTGAAGNTGGGFAYEITSSGAVTVLYNFCPQGGIDCTDANAPMAMIQGFDGNFYGTSLAGGANNPVTFKGGTVFKLTISPVEPTAAPGTAANGATYISGGLVPGSWAQVKGTDLSSVTRIWDAADFAGLGNNLPTNLSGIQVMVNNIAAPVYYISPGQISFQVPSGVSGNASVGVINNGVTSNSLTASASTSSPGIFPVIENGVNYPAGVFLDGEFVGDPSIQGFRNAKPGDVIQLYATGLASSPAGVIPSQQTLNGVTVTIGSTVIPADFAGLVAAGEFQINFTIPQSFANQPAGSYPISVQLAGVSSPTTINTSPPEQIVIPIQPQ